MDISTTVALLVIGFISGMILKDAVHSLIFKAPPEEPKPVIVFENDKKLLEMFGIYIQHTVHLIGPRPTATDMVRYMDSEVNKLRNDMGVNELTCTPTVRTDTEIDFKIALRKAAMIVTMTVNNLNELRN